MHTSCGAQHCGFFCSLSFSLVRMHVAVKCSMPNNLTICTFQPKNWYQRSGWYICNDYIMCRKEAYVLHGIKTPLCLCEIGVERCLGKKYRPKINFKPQPIGLLSARKHSASFLHSLNLQRNSTRCTQSTDAMRWFHLSMIKKNICSNNSCIFFNTAVELKKMQLNVSNYL